MGLIRELKEILKNELSKREEQKLKYRIEYAFTSGGTKYYRYEDIRNLPFERGLAALSIYNEVEMRCDRKLLKKYTDVVAGLLREKTIDIYKLNALNEMLQQRLSLTCDVDLMYKLASVVFFDKKENPLVYEQSYAEKKIERWKKDMSVNAFFLQMPLKELIPFSTSAEIDLDTYSKLNEEINALHSQLLRMNGSTSKRKD